METLKANNANGLSYTYPKEILHCRSQNLYLCEQHDGFLAFQDRSHMTSTLILAVGHLRFRGQIYYLDLANSKRVLFVFYHTLNTANH